jgi:hypothetical protein
VAGHWVSVSVTDFVGILRMWLAAWKRRFVLAASNAESPPRWEGF